MREQVNPKKITIKIAKLVLPIIAPLLRRAKRYYDAYKDSMPDWGYNAWANTYKSFCYVEKKLKYKPLISVVVPVFNPKYAHLLQAVYSVTNQHYPNWELILVNASSDKYLRKKTSEMSTIDTRIKVIDIPDNKGISKNTNIAIENSSGEFIALFDHDDLMHPCALHSAVEAMQGRKVPDFIYTDEDKITDDGEKYYNPHCKPGWSPDLIRNVNYITHLTVIRKKLIDRVGGLRSLCDGAQDYDLVLRVVDDCHPIIKHIPRILYSWRSTDKSTASNIGVKGYVLKAGIRALRDHMKRNKIPAEARIIEGKPGFYEVIYNSVDFAIVLGKVSLPKQQVVAKWLQKMLSYSNLKDRSVELVVGEWYKKFASHTPGVKVYYISDESRNHWKDAAELITKPVAICFKIAAMPSGKHDLSKLAGAAADPAHTAVSPIILSNDTILDAGIVQSYHLPKKLFEGYKIGKYTYFGNTDWVRNVDDLTTNIVAMSTPKLRELINFEVQAYSRGDTLMSVLPGSSLIGSSFVVWAHSTFDYRGLLKPATSSIYHNSQLFKFTPAVSMHVDNWGEGNVREQEK